MWPSGKWPTPFTSALININVFQPDDKNLDQMVTISNAYFGKVVFGNIFYHVIHMIFHTQKFMIIFIKLYTNWLIYKVNKPNRTQVIKNDTE